MSISDIVQQVQRQIRVADLQPLSEEKYTEYKVDTCSFDEWKTAVRGYGYDTDRFFVTPTQNYHTRYFYIGDYTSIGFPVIMRDWLENELNVRQLGADEHYKKMFEEGNYFMVFFPESNPFAIDYFIRHQSKIPRDEKFKVFSELYTLLEAGFGEFPTGIIDEIVELAPSGDSHKEIEDVYKPKDGKVTIYRGTHSKSTQLEESLSWTMSLKVAKQFANRFEEGKVYRAEVPVSDIIYFNNDRNEEEVWVRHESLQKVKKIK